MRKLLLAALIAAGVASSALAGIGTLKDNNGQSISTVDAVGAVPCVVFNSTAKSCFTGPGLVYGVVISSDVPGNYAVLRDSNTANTSSSSFTVVQNGSGTNSTVQLYKFPVPIAVTGGLSANLGANPPVGGQWTILYRKLTAND